MAPLLEGSKASFSLRIKPAPNKQVITKTRGYSMKKNQKPTSKTRHAQTYTTAQTTKAARAKGASSRSKGQTGAPGDTTPPDDEAQHGTTDFEHLKFIVFMTLRSLTEASKGGDVAALKILYEIAATATGILNLQERDACKGIAAQVEFWPVNLSPVRSWNRTQIMEFPEILGLGKGLKPIIDMEAVLKRGSRTNHLGALLVEFVEECRRFGVVARDVRNRYGREQTSRDLETAAEVEAQVTAPFRAAQRAMQRIADFVNVEWLSVATEEDLNATLRVVSKYSEKALSLPPLLSSKGANDRWFELGMELVRQLTHGEFQRVEFGLRNMNRRAGDGGEPGKERAGIRQGIKEGFDAVIRNVSSAGFVKVQ